MTSELVLGALGGFWAAPRVKGYAVPPFRTELRTHTPKSRISTAFVVDPRDGNCESILLLAEAKVKPQCRTIAPKSRIYGQDSSIQANTFQFRSMGNAKTHDF